MLGMFRYLKRQIYHGEYETRLEFLHKPIQPDGPDRITHADITVDNVYLVFACRLAPVMYEKWREKEYQAIGQIVLHQVCHLLTDPLNQLAKSDAAPSTLEYIQQINERQTQRICNVILSSRRVGSFQRR
jgi:hypothetical protein